MKVGYEDTDRIKHSRGLAIAKRLAKTIWKMYTPLRKIAGGRVLVVMIETRANFTRMDCV